MSTNQPYRRLPQYSGINAETGVPYTGNPLDNGYEVYSYPLNQTSIHNAVMLYFNALEDVSSYQYNENNQGTLPDYVNSQYLILEGKFMSDSYQTNKNVAYQSIMQDRDVATAMKATKLNSLDFFKQYKRTSAALWMIMPQAVRFQTNVGWEEVNSDPNALGLLGQAAARYSGGVVGGWEAIAALAKTVGYEFASNSIDALGSAGNLGGAIANSMQNTFNEMSFKGVQRRMFQLNWTLVPRSLAELTEIDAMIQRLRFHAHPGIQAPKNQISLEGAYLDFPGTIDLEWYTRGPEADAEWEENAWLPRISTCVIHSVDTDYSPNGQYSFFSNTGAATQINLSITLQEVMPLLKTDVARGF
jgi:hypothetical protein